MHFKISEIKPDRWEELDRLFQAAIELEPRQRTDFIAAACSGDPILQEEIEALLRSDADAWSFLDEPALQMAAPFVADEQPQLSAGDQLGDYTIERLIGRGGMGEVYLAKDRVLNRQVALKLLPSEYTRDPGRLQRFANEAQSASALNHPNILTIYQLGSVEGLQFIVTEFVEGETLRDLISQGVLTLSQVTDVIIQIASALAAAHKAGIVHRDIKPENIMLRPDGYVKVLDFGLAKLAEQYELIPADASVDVPNISSALLMGTVRYMSPEQARGLRVDARSDVFSIGVVLYEMLAGHAPFQNKDVPGLIESIVKQDPPPLTQYRPDVPGEILVVVSRALQKDRQNRYRSAEDLLSDLRAFSTDRRDHVSPSRSRSAGAHHETLKGKHKVSTADLLTQGFAETAGRSSDAIPYRRIFVSATLLLVVLAAITGLILYRRSARSTALASV